jgi:hypothetical protein
MIRSSRYLPTTGSFVLLLSLVVTNSYVGFPAFRHRSGSTVCLNDQDTYRFSNRNDGAQCLASESPFGPGADSNDNDPIAIQKGRALGLWKSVCRALKVPDDVVTAVTERLELGLVPPVFHAYVALFQRMGGAKKLQQDDTISAKENDMIPQALEKLPCMNRVTGGTVTSSQIGEIESLKDYNRAFFENGDGEARRKVQDENLVWTFSDPWTAIVCQLINGEAAMIGADVEVTEVDSDFGIGRVDKTSATHLITRKLSRGVVSESLNMPAARTRAIVGCPGIGKSWTLIYALQQLLLHDNACVLFFAAKRQRAFACIRQGDKIYVWTTRTKEADSNLFDFGDVWVLLDPKEAKRGSTDIVTGERRLLFAASSNEKHFTSDMGKRTYDPFYYLDPYTEDELYVALPVMSNEEFDERMMDWASKIGMLPRYLVNVGQYEQRLSLFDNFIKSMTNEDVKRLVASNGTSDGQFNIPGTVFAIRAARDGDEDNAKLPIGYDGESGVSYTKRSLSVITDYVWNEITKQNREYILSFWGVVQAFEFSKQGYHVEDLLGDDLRNRALFETWDMKRQKFVLSPTSAKGNFLIAKILQLQPSRMSLFKMTCSSA